MTRAIIKLGARLSVLPDAIIYNSETSAVQHEDIGYLRKKRCVIPNGFDCDEFRPRPEARERLRTKIHLRNETILIGLVARYHSIKDHQNFIAAAAIFSRIDPAVHFVLLGSGVTMENAELMGGISAAGMSNRIHLLGETQNVAMITAGFDIATSSSWSEAFPNVVGEAMACGVPCVVTDVGASAYLVGETGRVVPPKDPRALADGWQSILQLPEEERGRLGRSARQRILQYFSLTTVAIIYRDLYFQKAKLASAKLTTT